MQSAVIRQLEIMGEATHRLPPSFLNQYPDLLPWWAMKGMRNVLIHGYEQVDLETVWKTVTHDVLGVRQTLQDFIPVYTSDQETDLELGE